MAGRGAPPTGRPRQRNKAVPNGAKLDAGDTSAVVPKLPYRDDWHPQTIAWWVDVWQSPMRTEYTDSDYHGLVRLALVINDFWLADTTTARVAASVEARLQEARFGLSPVDRSRLRWETERGEEATAKGRQRRDRESKPAPAPQPDSGDDGLGALRVVR